MSLPEQIGRYRLQSVIGAGGFALVVRALDEALDDAVAVKILAENWAEDTEIRERFLEEARLLRRIRSDDLVTVHDIGELEDGRPYFVMDFADRGTLGSRLEARTEPGLDPPSARAVVATLAGGLGALHAAGIVHRDINPKNLLVRSRSATRLGAARAATPTRVRAGLIGTDERLLIGDLGLAKDVVRAGGAQVSLLGGTPHYVAPEQAHAAGRIRPATDVFAATGVLWEAITGTHPPQPGEFEAAATSVDETWRDFFRSGFATDPDDRYQSIAEWAAAAVERLDAATGTLTGTRPVRATPDAGPYKGLAAFQPEDAARFFGRSGLVAELVERLDRAKVLVVGGPSGSGKSSLIRAGLIPAIAAGALPGSERWPVALFTPRRAPVEELGFQLAKLDRATTQRDSDRPPADVTSARLVAESVAHRTGGVLLVIDQFEELFTLGSSREEQQTFVDILAGMVDPVDSGVRLVIGVRADFYALLAGYPWLAARVTENQVLVGPMNTSELREAIEQPARMAGLDVEAGLVDLILDDGADEPGALPLVSHALAETWRRRQGTRMTIAGYREAGGVAGAIAKTAEALYQGSFDDGERQACRRLMLRLVTPGEGTSDTRRRLPRDEVDADPDPETVRRVADQLTAARLVTVDRDGLDIAHEALIQTWPRLREWIEESRDDLRMRQHLARAAAEWELQERSPDLLYRGTPLTTAREWAVEHGEVLGPLEREFLEASIVRHELQAAQAAAASRRSRRLRRTAVSVLAVLAVVAATAGLLAFRAFRQAEARFAQSLATQASGLADSNPRLALALAVEAMVRGATDSVDARAALVDATVRLQAGRYEPARSALAPGDPLSVAMRRDGGLIATGLRDGSLLLFDGGSGEQIGDPMPGHDRGIEDMVFTPDGTTLFTAGSDGRILRWNVTDPGRVPPPAEFGAAADVVWGLSLDPGATTLASASEDGTIRLWDVATSSQLGEPLVDTGFDFLTVAFHPIEALVVAGNGQGELWGWTLPDRSRAFPPTNLHGSDIWEIVFSAEGHRIVTGSADGTIKVWNAATLALEAEPFAAMEDVQGVQITPDGTIVAGDQNGRVHVAVPGMPVRVSGAAHERQIFDAAMSSDGGRLATIGEDQRLNIWTPTTELVAAPLGGHEGGATALAVSLDGQVLVAGDATGMVRSYDPRAPGTPAALRVVPASISALSFGDTSNRLIAGGGDGSVSIVDPVAGSVTTTRGGAHLGEVSAVVVTGDRVVSGGADGIVRVWNADLGSLEHELGPHPGGVTSLVVVAGTTVAASDVAGGVTRWNVADGSIVGRRFVADDNAIWDLVAHGDLLATASGDEVVTVWRDGRRVVDLNPLDAAARSVAIVLDGTTIVSGTDDGVIRLWDSELGDPLGDPLPAHDGAVLALAVFPDGAHFASAGQDGAVRIWDVLALDAACRRTENAFDERAQLRFLGSERAARGCVGG